MNDVFLDDSINPRYVHFSSAASVAAAVDRAIRAWTRNLSPIDGGLSVESLEPIAGPIRVDLWVEQLDDSACTYAFLVSSENGNVPHARGERTVLAPRSARNAELLKELPAYA
jgi:hypothetical protein